LAFDDFCIGLVISLRVTVLAFDDFCIGFWWFLYWLSY
jgi:hypothetical protein